jgi:nitroreductase/dihydropteridine reductase
MAFIEFARNRYTTKKYTNNEIISEEKIAELKEILALSPSSINSQPWKFFFISDQETKNLFAAASSFNGEKIREASHLVVFSVIDSVADFVNNRLSQLPEGSKQWFNEVVKSLGDKHVESWMAHQVYLALGFFLAACASMDIDSTTMEGINTFEYDKILDLKGYKTLFAVSIGYRDVKDTNQPIFTTKSRRDIMEVVKFI